MTFRTLLATLAVATTFASVPVGAQTAAPVPDPAAGAMRTVKILPPDASRSLKFTRMPTTQSVPLIFGTYWDCHDNVHGFEQCGLVMVVCTNDQSLCVEV